MSAPDESNVTAHWNAPELSTFTSRNSVPAPRVPVYTLPELSHDTPDGLMGNDHTSVPSVPE